ncbi:hypothetical protein SCOR_19120 [Sulfidibacter corallicola]|uniref:Novel STAND NTPase 5 domain-containing protein n=1 Tax=Sulfidibacter corallicola TaxID=2818388 RepID=A0A8A4TV90_SULCO|nr:ATP-binding protein [Sulfidibacter corallicola]QTD53440.1 hypothetical protein J3U87_13380 [Sulfidibacter corallicola]
MTFDELIARIARASQQRRLSLFLGDAPALALDYPTLETALDQLADYFLSGESLDSGRKGRVTKYRDQRDWLRLTKTIADAEPEAYLRQLKRLFAGPWVDQPSQPPWWLRALIALKPVLIVTADRGPLPTASIARGYTPVTWRDRDLLDNLPHAEGHHLVAVQGHSLEPANLVLTLDQMKAFSGEHGEPVRRLLRRIRVDHLCLLAGFRAEDPFLTGLALSAGPALENLVALAAPNSFPHLTELTTLWPRQSEAPEDPLRTVASRLIAEINGQLPPEIEPSPGHETGEAVPLGLEDLRRLPPAEENRVRDFYRGHPIDWTLVRDGHTIPRREAGQVIDLIAKGRKAVLVTGPTGTGKSTILMQAAQVLLEEGYTIIRLKKPQRVTKVHGNLAILVEDGSRYYGLANLIQEMGRRKGVVVLIAARTHEWANLQGMRRQANLAAIARIAVKELNPSEIRCLAEKLVETGACSKETDVASLTQRLESRLNGNRDLLAALLEATHGRKLVDILTEALEEIAGWIEGCTLLELLGSIVLIEALPTKSGTSLACSAKLLGLVLGLPRKALDAALDRLRGEVRPRHSGVDDLVSRDEVIGSHLYRILFEGDSPLLDVIHVGTQVLWAAHLVGMAETRSRHRQLMSMIPNHFRDRGAFRTAEELYMAATRVSPRDPITWQNWARMAADPKTKGWLSKASDPRRLFEKAALADPHHAPAWQAWALMEAHADNHPEARRLFKRATLVDPGHAPSWQAWALMEARADNRAEARRLFERATLTAPHNIPSWRAWAAMELDWGEVKRAEELIAKASANCPPHEFEALIRKITEHQKRSPKQATRPEPPRAAPPQPSSRLVEWTRRTKSEIGISEYQAYLAAQHVRRSANADRDQRFLALAMIAPHLRKCLLREADSTQLPTAPAFLLTLPPEFEPNRKATRATRCFAVTRQGSLFTWLAAPRLQLFGEPRLPVEPQKIFDIPDFDSERSRVLGLYLGTASTFDPTVDLFLAAESGEQPLLFQFGLGHLDQPPIERQVLPAWMRICPVSARPGTQIADLHTLAPALEDEDHPAWAVLWNKRLWRLASGNLTAPDILRGTQATVLADRLYVLRTDQSIALFGNGEDRLNRIGRRFFRRQPVALAALPDLDGQGARLLVGYRDGRIRICADVSEPREEPWGEGCWRDIASALVAELGLNHLAAWPQWLEDIAAKRFAHEVCRPQSALQVGARLFYEFLLTQPNLEGLGDWNYWRWLTPPLGPIDYLPLLQAMRGRLRNWRRTHRSEGAAAFLAIYESLPHELREILDTYIHVSYHLDAPNTPPGTQSRDAEALAELRSRCCRTRRKFMADPNLPLAVRASIQAEIQLGFPLTQYFAKGSHGEGAHVLWTSRRGLFLWDDGHSVQTFSVTCDQPRDRLPRGQGNTGIRSVVEFDDCLHLAELNTTKLRTWRVDTDGRFGEPEIQNFPEAIRPLRVVDAGGNTLLVLSRQDHPQYGFRLLLWHRRGGGSVAAELPLRAHPLTCLAHQVVTPGTRWHIALAAGEGEWIFYGLEYVEAWDKLTLSEPFRYRSRGNVTCLNFASVGEKTWVLVGTDGGYIQVFEQVGEPMTGWRLKWLHATATEVRGIHVLSTPHHCRVLCFTSQGEVFVFDGDGRLHWHRHFYVSLVQGRLLSPATVDETTFFAVLCDARGIMALMAFEEPAPWESIVEAYRTQVKKPRRPPYTEIEVFQGPELAPCALARLVGDPETNTSHRALYLRDFGAKVLSRGVTDDQDRANIVEAAQTWSWAELEGLASFDGSHAQPNTRLWLTELLLELLARVYREEKAQTAAESADLRGTRVLADLVRGVGRELITPTALSSGKLTRWALLPSALKRAPAVCAAVILNQNLEGDEDALIGKLIAQAGFLGPDAFRALVLLAPAKWNSVAWYFGEVMGLESPRQDLGKVPFALEAEQLSDFPGVLFDFCRFLWEPERNLEFLIGAAERLTNLDYAEISQRFHSDLAILFDWLRPLAEIAKFQPLPKERQLQRLAEIGANSPVQAQSPTEAWETWIDTSRQRFMARRHDALGHFRQELLDLTRLRLENPKWEYRAERLVQLSFRPTIDGDSKQAAVHFSISLPPNSGVVKAEPSLALAWPWDGVPADRQTFRLQLEEGCQEVRLVCCTLVSGEEKHCQDWRLPLPPHPHTAPERLLGALPDLVAHQVSEWSRLSPGLHLLAFDPDLGEEVYLEAARQCDLPIVALDALFTGPKGELFSDQNILAKVGWDHSESAQNEPHRQILVTSAVDTVERLLKKESETVLRKFQEALRRGSSRTSCWLLPKSLAFTLSGRLGESALLVPLFAPKKLPLHLQHDLILWVMARSGVRESQAAAVVGALGNHLSLIDDWTRAPTSLDTYLKESSKPRNLLTSQFRGLSPLALANLIILVYCRTWIPAVRPIPAEVTCLPEKNKNDEGRGCGQDLSEIAVLKSDKRSDVRSHSAEPEGTWVRGYHAGQGRNPKPSVLNALRDLGDALPDSERNLCRHLLQDRGILGQEEGLVFLRQPYLNILEQWVDPESWGRSFAETILEAPFYQSLGFRALAKAGKGLRSLISHMTQAGLDTLAELGSPSPDWGRLAELLSGAPAQLVQELELSGPQQRLLGDIRARLGPTPVFSIHQNAGSPVRSDLPEASHIFPQASTNWLVFCEVAHEPDQAWWRNMIANYEVGVTLILVYREVSHIPSAKSNRVSFLDSGALKEMAGSNEVADTFWLHVRNRIGLLRFNIYQAGSPLIPGSEVFVGRTRETERILAGIDAASFLVIGGRKIGKTSLLHHIEDVLTKLGTITPLYIDLQGVVDSRGFWRQFVKTCRKKKLAFVTSGDIEERLSRTLATLPRPVLLLNEVDGLALYANPFLVTLRRMSHDGECQFVMAGYQGAYGGLEQANSALHNWFPVSEGSPAIVLGSLDSEAATSLVDLLETSRLRLQYEDPQLRAWARTELPRRTHGIPILLQEQCDLIVRRLDARNSTVITRADLAPPAGDPPIWSLFQRIQVPFDVASRRSSPNAAPRHNYKEHNHMRLWRFLLMSATVHCLYIGRKDGEFSEEALRRVKNGAVHFTVLEAWGYAHEQLRSLNENHRQMAFREFTLDVCKNIFDYLALTVFVGVEVDEETRYHFHDHLYPNELRRFLHRKGREWRDYLDNLAKRFGKSLAELEASS